MSADKDSSRTEHLTRDAKEFGLVVAKAVLSEFEGEASEERLKAVRNVLMRAIDHIEERYGSDSAALWLDEANRAIQQRIAALNPRQDNPPDENAGEEV
jgi:hypothetical protein